MVKVTREKKREIVRQKRYGKKDEHCQVEIKIEGNEHCWEKEKKEMYTKRHKTKESTRKEEKEIERESEKERERSKEERYRVRIKIESKKQSRGDVAKIAN